jgi:anaerobic selenocysteine-containing dehydrogenase
VLRTPSGLAELAPEPLLADVARLQAALDQPADTELVMVGRRQLRSNNSWMHNLPVLVKGRPRCTLQVNTEDAARLGLADGEKAEVASVSGSARLVVALEVTGAIRPGVVSLPHGWGHDLPGVRLGVAAAHAGVNSNLLAGAERYDPLSGNAVLNGIPVVVSPLPQESDAEDQPAARSAAGVT